LLDILSKRVVLVTGKGGVGRTTLAAAIALAAASAGKRVVLAEIGAPPSEHTRSTGARAWSPLARIFGRETLPVTPEVVHPGVRGVLLWSRTGHEAFLRTVVPVGPLIKVAMGSRALSRLLDAAPSFNEMGVYYHLLELLRAKDNDLIVVDMPATGHTLALAGLPDILLRLMPSGPIADALREGQRWLHDADRAGAWIVTLPETLPVTEAIELGEGLRQVKVAVGGVLLNKWVEDEFHPDERAALEPLLASRDFYGALRFAATARARDEAERLAHGAEARVTRVPELEAHGLPLVQELAAALARGRS